MPSPGVLPIAATSADPALRAHIDRLRGCFAVGVMLGHSVDLAYGAGQSDYTLQLMMTIRPLLGFVWVVGFIVLSGYCVTQSCLRAAPRQTPAGFAALRLTRLFPLLWTSVALAVLVEAVVGRTGARPAVWALGVDRAHILVNLAGLGGFYGQYGSLAPAYTISYELLFYALWAIAWFGTARRPAAAIAASAGLGLVFRALRPLLPIWSQVVVNDFVLLLFACWCLGAALAFWLPALARTAAARVFAPFRWLVVTAVMVIGWGWFTMPLLQATPASAVYYPVLALAFAGLTIGFAARSDAPGGASIDAWLGELSYPLFVTHGPVIIAAATLYRRMSVHLPFGLYLAAIVAPALVAAHVFAVGIDRPVMAWRKRIRASWRREPSTNQDASPVR